MSSHDQKSSGEAGDRTGRPCRYRRCGGMPGAWASHGRCRRRKAAPHEVPDRGCVPAVVVTVIGLPSRWSGRVPWVRWIPQTGPGPLADRPRRPLAAGYLAGRVRERGQHPHDRNQRSAQLGPRAGRGGRQRETSAGPKTIPTARQ
jgi:hypothetical protein